MIEEKRKSRRQPMSYSSSVVSLDGKRKYDCRLADISASGARLIVEDPAQIEDDFVLMLSERGKVMRLCRVVRRIDKQIAVLFRATSNPFPDAKN